MANDRVQAKIDLTKGKDETSEIKSSLSSFQTKVNDARDELVRLAGSTTDTSAKLAIAKQRLEEAAGSANTKKSALMGLISEVDKYDKQLKETGDAEEDTTKKGHSFASSLRNIRDTALGVGLERLAVNILNVGKSAVTSSIQLASSYQEWKASFDVMLGSADKASKLMKDINQYAFETAFDPSEVVQMTQGLIANNIAYEKLIPTLKEFGDIAGGVGKEKMPNLLYAYEQVQAFGKLRTPELNQFSNNSFNLAQALADYFNSTGNTVTAASTKIEKGTKVSAEQMTKLKNNLTENQMQLKILENQHVKAGEATDKHNLAITRVKNNIAELNAKISGANKIVSTGGGARKNLSQADIRDMVEKGKVTAGDVEAAIAKSTGPGSKFYGLQKKMSEETLTGVMSNLKEKYNRLLLTILGIDDNSKVKAGSIFDRITKAAQALLAYLEQNQDKIIAFGQSIGDKILQVADWITHTLLPTLVNLYKWVEQNRWILAIVAGVLGGVLIVAIVGVVSAVGGFIAAVIAAIGTVAAFVTSAVGIAAIIGGVVVGAIALAILYWDQLKATIYNVGTWIKGFAIDIANSVIDMINGMLGALEGFINGAAKLASKIPGVKMEMAQIGRLDKLAGGNGMKFGAGNLASGLLGGMVGGAGGIAGAAASYLTSSNNKSVNITNNNNFSTASDPMSFAQYQAWQINGR